jgi:hypothetical protein
MSSPSQSERVVRRVTPEEEVEKASSRQNLASKALKLVIAGATDAFMRTACREHLHRIHWTDNMSVIILAEEATVSYISK